MQICTAERPGTHERVVHSVSRVAPGQQLPLQLLINIVPPGHSGKETQELLDSNLLQQPQQLQPQAQRVLEHAARSQKPMSILEHPQKQQLQEQQLPQVGSSDSCATPQQVQQQQQQQPEQQQQKQPPQQQQQHVTAITLQHAGDTMANTAPASSVLPAAAMQPRPNSTPPAGALPSYSNLSTVTGSGQGPLWHMSPMSCWSMPSPEQLAVMSAAAHSTTSCSMQSVGSCSGLGLSNIVRKYKRAKSLLQGQLQETQRLKSLVEIESQKAATAAMQAKALESQLASSTASMQEAQAAQQQLQQQLSRLQHSDQDGADREKQEQLQMLNQQLQELQQHNTQLQLKYEVATKQLALQQQLSVDLTTQLQAAETQLKQAQEMQQSLLAELRHQQQLQLEMRLEAPGHEDNSQRIASLHDQLTVAKLAAADKDRHLQELTVKWQEAANQVEELQQQLRRESGHHQRLLRASQDSWAYRHAQLLDRLQKHLQQIEHAEAASSAASGKADATAAVLHAKERQQLEQQQWQLQEQLITLNQKVHRLESDQSGKDHQREELMSMCAQLLDQQEAAQAAVIAAAQMKEQLQHSHRQQLAEMQEAHAAALESAQQRHQEDLDAQKAALKALQQAHASDMKAIQLAHQYELATQKLAHRAEKDALHSSQAAALREAAGLKQQLEEVQAGVCEQEQQQHQHASIAQAQMHQLQHQLAAVQELADQVPLLQQQLADALTEAGHSEQLQHQLAEALAVVQQVSELEQQAANAAAEAAKLRRQLQKATEAAAQVPLLQDELAKALQLVNEAAELQQQLAEARKAAEEAPQLRLQLTQALDIADQVPKLQQQLADALSAADEAAELQQQLEAATGQASELRQQLAQALEVAQQVPLFKQQLTEVLVEAGQVAELQQQLVKAQKAVEEAAQLRQQLQQASIDAQQVTQLQQQLEAATTEASQLRQQLEQANELADTVPELQQQLAEALRLVDEGTGLQQQLAEAQKAAEVAEQLRQQLATTLEAAGQVPQLKQQLAAAQAVADKVPELQQQVADMQAAADRTTGMRQQHQNAVQAARSQLCTLQQQLSTSHAAVEASNKRVKELQEQLAASQAASQEATNEAWDLQKQLDEANAAAQITNSEIDALLQQLSTAQNAAQAANSQVEALQQQLTATQAAAQAAWGREKTLRLELTAAKASVHQSKDEVSHLQQQLAAAQDSATTAAQEVDESKQQLSKAQSGAAAAQEKIEQLLREQAAAAEASAASASALAQEQQQLAAATQQVAELQQQLAVAKAAVAQATSLRAAKAAAGDAAAAKEVASLQQQLAAAAASQQALQKEIHSLQGKVCQLQQQLSAAQSAAASASPASTQHPHQQTAELRAQPQGPNTSASAAAARIAEAAHTYQALAAALTSAVSGLQHQVLLAEAKARLLEPLARRKSLQVQHLLQQEPASGKLPVVAPAPVAMAIQSVASHGGAAATETATVQQQTNERAINCSTAPAAAAEVVDGSSWHKGQEQVLEMAFMHHVATTVVEPHQHRHATHQQVLADAVEAGYQLQHGLPPQLHHSQQPQQQQLQQHVPLQRKPWRHTVLEDADLCMHGSPIKQQWQQPDQGAATGSDEGASAQVLAQVAEEQEEEPTSDGAEEISSMLSELQQQLSHVEQQRRAASASSGSSRNNRKHTGGLGKPPRTPKAAPKADQQQQQTPPATHAQHVRFSGAFDQQQGLQQVHEQQVQMQALQQQQQQPSRQSDQQQQRLYTDLHGPGEAWASPAARVSWAGLSAASTLSCGSSLAATATPQHRAACSVAAAATARSGRQYGSSPGMHPRRLFSSSDGGSSLAPWMPWQQEGQEQRLPLTVASPAVERSPGYVLHHNLLYDLPSYVNFEQQAELQQQQQLLEGPTQHMSEVMLKGPKVLLEQQQQMVPVVALAQPQQQHQQQQPSPQQQQWRQQPKQRQLGQWGLPLELGLMPFKQDKAPGGSMHQHRGQLLEGSPQQQRPLQQQKHHQDMQQHHGQLVAGSPLQQQKHHQERQLPLERQQQQSHAFQQEPQQQLQLLQKQHHVQFLHQQLQQELQQQQQQQQQKHLSGCQPHHQHHQQQPRLSPRQRQQQQQQQQQPQVVSLRDVQLQPESAASSLQRLESMLDMAIAAVASSSTVVTNHALSGGAKLEQLLPCSSAPSSPKLSLLVCRGAWGSAGGEDDGQQQQQCLQKEPRMPVAAGSLFSVSADCGNSSLRQLLHAQAAARTAHAVAAAPAAPLVTAARLAGGANAPAAAPPDGGAKADLVAERGAAGSDAGVAQGSSTLLPGSPGKKSIKAASGAKTQIQSHTQRSKCLVAAVRKSITEGTSVAVAMAAVKQELAEVPAPFVPASPTATSRACCDDQRAVAALQQQVAKDGVHAPPQPAAADALQPLAATAHLISAAAAATAAADVGCQTDSCVGSSSAELQVHEQKRQHEQRQAQQEQQREEQQQQEPHVQENTADGHLVHQQQAVQQLTPQALSGPAIVPAASLGAEDAGTNSSTTNNDNGMPSAVAQLLEQLQQQYQRCQVLEQQMMQQHVSQQQQQQQQQQQSTSAAHTSNLEQPGQEDGSQTNPDDSSHMLQPVTPQDEKVTMQQRPVSDDSTTPRPAAGQQSDGGREDAEQGLPATPAGPQLLQSYHQAVQQALAAAGSLQQFLVTSSGKSGSKIQEQSSSPKGLPLSLDRGGAGSAAAAAVATADAGLSPRSAAEHEPDSQSRCGGRLQRWQQQAQQPSELQPQQQEQEQQQQSVLLLQGAAAPGTPWKQDLAGQVESLQQQLLKTQQRLQLLESGAHVPQQTMHDVRQQRQQQQTSIQLPEPRPRLSSRTCHTLPPSCTDAASGRGVSACLEEYNGAGGAAASVARSSASGSPHSLQAAAETASKAAGRPAQTPAHDSSGEAEATAGDACDPHDDNHSGRASCIHKGHVAGIASGSTPSRSQSPSRLRGMLLNLQPLAGWHQQPQGLCVDDWAHNSPASPSLKQLPLESDAADGRSTAAAVKAGRGLDAASNSSNMSISCTRGRFAASPSPPSLGAAAMASVRSVSPTGCTLELRGYAARHSLLQQSASSLRAAADSAAGSITAYGGCGASLCNTAAAVCSSQKASAAAAGGSAATTSRSIDTGSINRVTAWVAAPVRCSTGTAAIVGGNSGGSPGHSVRRSGARTARMVDAISAAANTLQWVLESGSLDDEEDNPQGMSRDICNAPQQERRQQKQSAGQLQGCEQEQQQQTFRSHSAEVDQVGSRVVGASTGRDSICSSSRNAASPRGPAWEPHGPLSSTSSRLPTLPLQAAKHHHARRARDAAALPAEGAGLGGRFGLGGSNRSHSRSPTWQSQSRDSSSRFSTPERAGKVPGKQQQHDSGINSSSRSSADWEARRHSRQRQQQRRGEYVSPAAAVTFWSKGLRSPGPAVPSPASVKQRKAAAPAAGPELQAMQTPGSSSPRRMGGGGVGSNQGISRNSNSKGSEAVKQLQQQQQGAARGRGWPAAAGLQVSASPVTATQQAAAASWASGFPPGVMPQRQQQVTATQAPGTQSPAVAIVQSAAAASSAHERHPAGRARALHAFHDAEMMPLTAHVQQQQHRPQQQTQHLAQQQQRAWRPTAVADGNGGADSDMDYHTAAGSGSDSEDVSASGEAAWSGPGPLMSSTARQAALRQLKQYQMAWRWSQKAADDEED